MTIPYGGGREYHDLRDPGGRFVSVSGLSAAARKVAEVGRRARDLRPVWPRVGDMMAELAAEQFATRGARLGTGWAPLNPDYRRFKIKAGGGTRTLIWTEALMRSWTSRPMGVEEHGRKEATFGSDDYKAAWHQYGTRNMPARPVLIATPEVDADVAGLLGHYIATGRVKRR